MCIRDRLITEFSGFRVYRVIQYIYNLGAGLKKYVITISKKIRTNDNYYSTYKTNPFMKITKQATIS